MTHTTKHPTAVFKDEKVQNTNWSTGRSVVTFLIGVILLWSFGKYWLNFESALVFLAGLIGVAIPVLIFAAWKIYHRPQKDDE